MTDLGITGNLIASILYDAAKGIYRQFDDPFNKALKDTSIYFLSEKDIEFRISGLRKILRGDMATDEVEKFKMGDGFIDEDKLALQFAKFGDLYFEEESQILPIAREILRYFIQRFEYYLLEKPDTGLHIIKGYHEKASDEHSTILSILQKMEQTFERLTQNAPTLNKPDIRIKLNWKFLVRINYPNPKPALSVEIQNHAPLSVILNTIRFRLQNRKRLTVMKDSDTGEWLQRRRELRPGESFSFTVYPEKLFEKCQLEDFVSVEVIDDIDRVYESESGSLKKTLAPMWTQYNER